MLLLRSDLGTNVKEGPKLDISKGIFDRIQEAIIKKEPIFKDKRYEVMCVSENEFSPFVHLLKCTTSPEYIMEFINYLEDSEWEVLCSLVKCTQKSQTEFEVMSPATVMSSWSTANKFRVLNIIDDGRLLSWVNSSLIDFINWDDVSAVPYILNYFCDRLFNDNKKDFISKLTANFIAMPDKNKIVLFNYLSRFDINLIMDTIVEDLTLFKSEKSIQKLKSTFIVAVQYIKLYGLEALYNELRTETMKELINFVAMLEGSALIDQVLQLQKDTDSTEDIIGLIDNDKLVELVRSF